MPEIKIINTNIIGNNPYYNQLTEVFDNKYYYEYRWVDGKQIILPNLPITANLYAWYTSDTLEQDYNRDGSLVNTWRDSSGNNRDLIQENINKQPIYYKYFFPKPCVGIIQGQFLYSNEIFTDIAGTNSKTVFCVFAKTAMQTTDCCVCGISGNTSPQYGWFCIFSGNYSGGSKDYRFVTYGNDNDNSFRGYTSLPRVAVAAYGLNDLPSKTRVFMNNIKYTDKPSINPNTNNTNFLVGRACRSNTNFEDTSWPFWGVIYEIIVYSSSLTDQEISDVSNYLMLKYNIPEEI